MYPLIITMFRTTLLDNSGEISETSDVAEEILLPALLIVLLFGFIDEASCDIIEGSGFRTGPPGLSNIESSFLLALARHFKTTFPAKYDNFEGLSLGVKFTSGGILFVIFTSNSYCKNNFSIKLIRGEVKKGLF